MFLSENQKLLILYHPGARGDFLASILLSSLRDGWELPRIQVKQDYIKLHNVYNRVFTRYPAGLAPINDNLSIRIKVNSIEDVLTITNNIVTKLNGINNVENATAIAEDIINDEYNHRRLDSLFDYVADFKQLSRPNSLHILVNQITGKFLDKDAMERIRFNISLQDQVNLDNYQNHLNIDIDRVLKYYELRNGFN